MASTFTTIAAARGTGILINGTRVGMFQSFKRPASKKPYCGVGYLILGAADTAIIQRQGYVENQPFEVTYISRQQPTLAAVSRAYISFLAKVGDEDIRFVGFDLRGRLHPYRLQEMQEALITFSDWVDSCIAS